MTSHILKVKLGKPFGNLYRKRHILILCMDLEGNLLLGNKPYFYPEGISRMIGGGLNENETSVNGAIREIEEELGIQIDESDLKQVAEVNIEAETIDGIKNLITYIYFYQVKKDDILKPGDDVKSIAKLNYEEYENLISRYLNLIGNFDGDGESFEWIDYGKVYGPIHQIALDWVKVNI
jgi:8-oxo-dGTP pyrophosphatase MutT (NUDIX family)